MSADKITILNGSGNSKTSPEAAIKLIERGDARYVDDQTIEIIDARWKPLLKLVRPSARDCHPRHGVRHSPDLGKVVEFKPDTFTGQTFLHYPQKAA